MGLDDSDKKIIGDLIKAGLEENNKVLDNKFVTGEAAAKIVTQGLTEGLQALKLDEKITAAVEKLKPAATGDDDDNKGKGKGNGKADDPNTARLAQQLTEVQEQLRKEAKARETAELGAREQKLETAIGQALDAAGIPGSRHKHVLPYLRGLTTDDGKPALVVNGDGKPVWRVQRKGYVDDLDLTKAAKEWVDTEDGKSYLPATNVQGTGKDAGKAPTTPRTEKGGVDWAALQDRAASGVAAVIDGLEN